ncbi:hypothetical protein JKY72_04695 [Candidatus Gracilibacteria bacterium]|nr:hypothetical protein [Candidatus Gracilibacteria bacterium]
MDIQNFLSQLGLSEKESQVYLSSLKYGSQTASTLALKTKLPRSTVNFVFADLLHKGFASKESKSNSTYYTATPPEDIRYNLDQKKASLRKLESDFNEILPYLEGLQTSGTPMPKVRYYEGLEGLYRTIDDCCDQDETVHFISSHNNMHPKIRDYIEKIYIPRSQKHKNKNVMIINEGQSADTYLQKAAGVYKEVHKVDPQKNLFKLTTAIHGNNTLFISYAPEDLSGLIIENELIADHMRTIFDIVKKGL